MAHWLVKSEPGSWSWDDHVRVGVEPWNGVRNHQACNNMKAMKKGDTAFFYHSVNEKQIVGVLKVVKEYYPDPSDASGRFGMVDFKAMRPVKTPVTLQQIKDDGRLDHLALIKQSRLSVMPIDDNAWQILCGMAGIKP
ncbi:MAG: EVE domain-containing protein [Hyphomicrobiales bacterium]|nr:EVE domain-containing protein [Hyphomicrobiales bacterium]MCP5370419.1 EVE domain-containing protein [Hyphomicrobiales bacterium]